MAEFNFPDGRPEASVLKPKIDSLGLTNSILQPTGETGYILKTKFISEEERVALVNTLSDGGKVKLEEKRFNSVGPVIGDELKRKAIIAIVLVIICIILFITFTFRKVSKPVASWKYGLVAIMALIHDILIPSGVFALLVKYQGAEIDILFTTALLAILGLSINDTIVVFDRIRENLRINEEARGKKDFETVVGESMSQTYLRSFNTSFTVILALIALYFLGGETTQNFALVLLVGMVAGTYSSIFLASPLLVVLNNWQKKAVK